MARNRTVLVGTIAPGIERFYWGPGYSDPFPDPAVPYWNKLDTGTGSASYNNCVDTIMPPPYVTDHDLEITHKRVHPVRLYGRINASPTINSHEEPRGHILAFKSYADCPPASLPSAAAMKTRALANMNPNRPVVDMTEFITQFTDLPRLVRNLGRLVASKETRKKTLSKKAHVSDLSDAWLSWSFGWAPLISDAIALFDMPRQIELRKEYLRNLEGGTHLRRKIYSTNEDVFGPVVGYMNGWTPGTYAIQYRSRTTTTVRSWYTANAKLLNPLPASPIAQAELARQLTYPLGFSPATAWELLPWSWLIDYFVNVGSYLDASQQDLPWQCTRLNVMTNVKVRQTFIQVNRTKDTSATLNPNGFGETEILSRAAYTNPTPSIGFLPLLTEGHIANISALAVSRIRNAR